MIYTLKRTRYSDDIKSDNAIFYAHNDIVLNTKNIFSVEEYQELDDTEIYGIRINGIKYPIFIRQDVKWLVANNEKNKEKQRFLQKLCQDKGCMSYSDLPEEKQDWWDDFFEEVDDLCEKEYDYIDKQIEKIIKIMKEES